MHPRRRAKLFGERVLVEERVEESQPTTSGDVYYRSPPTKGSSTPFGFLSSL